MNPNVDLQSFGAAPGNAGVLSPIVSTTVAPPRRIFSRVLVPVLLLAGFAAMGAYAFRDSFEPAVAVRVTFPVSAGGAIAAAATDRRDEARRQQDSAVEVPSAPDVVLFQAPGWIEPRPFPIAITALQPGTVDKVLVIEGQQVTSGTLIATLVDDDARLAVKQAEGELELKQAELIAAKQNWENPTDLREAVSTAEASGAQLSAEKLRMAESLHLAELQSQAGRKLNQAGFEPGLTFEKAYTDQKLGRLNLAETSAKISLNSATLQAARERLALRTEDRKRMQSAEADVFTAQTALEKARLQLSRTKIMAPTSGTIMTLAVNPGMMLSPDIAGGMSIAMMYRPEMLQARVDVPLSEAARVIPGLEANVRLEAMPEKIYHGRLLNIVPQADIQKNVLPVKVSIDNPDNVLRPEMISRVEFVSRQSASKKESAKASGQKQQVSLSEDEQPPEARRSASWLLPASAVHGEGDSGTLFVVQSDGRAHAVEVKVQSKKGTDQVAVMGNLNVPDQVISWSAKPIKSGDRVKIQE
jgi:multidrug efflux pump subunit AcrA (membrane-fusion protein)